MPRTTLPLCEACGQAVDVHHDRHYTRTFPAPSGRSEAAHVRVLCFPCAGTLGPDRDAFLQSTLPPAAKRRAAA